MGGSSKSYTKETTLSKEQTKILKVHEAQYQSVLFPALRSMIMKNVDVSNVEMSPWLVAQQDKVTKAFSQVQTAVGQGLAQRGIAQGGVGSLTRGRVAQAGALDRVNLLQQAVGQQQQGKLTAMDLLSRHSPQSTSAAPLTSKSKGADTTAANVATVAAAAIGLSDARLKENIEPIGDALGKVMQLRGVNFDWSGENAANHPQPEEGRQLGFLAQEVEKVIPEVVQTFGDGYKAVAYGQINALLIEAIKDQQELLNAQAERLEVLESEVYR